MDNNLLHKSQQPGYFFIAENPWYSILFDEKLEPK